MQIITTETKHISPAALGANQVRALREKMHAAYGKTDRTAEQIRAELDALALPVVKAKNFPQEDFLMLRLSTKLSQKNLRAQQRENDLRQEEDLIVRTASYAPSVRVLDIYLARALKRYRALSAGDKPDFSCEDKEDKKCLTPAAQAREKALKVRAVRACLARLCARRAWALSLGVLRHYKEMLGEDIFRAYCHFIRTGFAQDKGEMAWKNTPAPDAPEQRLSRALQALESEPDPELKQTAQAHVRTLHARAKAALCALQSQVYAQLLTGETADVSVLAGAEIAPALSAAQAVTTPQGSDAETFNTLYFEGAPETIYKAFASGKISARDYLILMRVCYARAAGNDDFSAYALADALTLFCVKNNLSAYSTQEMVCAVLRTAPEEQLSRALALKKIYQLQESSK